MVVLQGDVSIVQAAHWREHLLQAVAADATGEGPFVVDAAGVADFDSAGVQLLLALRALLERDGRRLQLHAPSASVRDALAAYGLETMS